MSKSHFYIVETSFDVFNAQLIMYLSNIYMQIPKYVPFMARLLLVMQ